MASVETQQPPAEPALPDYVVSPNAVLQDASAAWRYGRAPDYSKTRKFYAESTFEPLDSSRLSVTHLMPLLLSPLSLNMASLSFSQSVPGSSFIPFSYRSLTSATLEALGAHAKGKGAY